MKDERGTKDNPSRVYGERMGKFEVIFNSANDGIFIVDSKNKKALLANKRFREMLGYDEVEVMSLGVHDLHPIEYLPHVLEQFEKQSKNELIIAKDLPVVRKDGTIFYADVSAAPLKLGGIPAQIGIFRDVTQEKEANESLMESEAKYRALIEKMPLGIVIGTGPSPKLVFANPSFARIIGYTLEELYSFTPEQIMSLVHPDNRELFFTSFSRRLLGHEMPQGYEIKGVHKDGSIVWLRVSGSTISYQGSVAVQSIFADVTEQKQSELIMRESEERYRAMVRSIDEGLIIVEQGQIIFINEQMSYLTGYSIDELSSTSDLYLSLPGVAKQLELVSNLQKEGHDYPAQMDLWINCKKGDSKYVTVRISSATTPGGNQLLFLLLTDITDRKRMEEKLEQRAETAMFYLDIMGHDITNQLQVILMSAERLLESNDPEKGNEKLDSLKLAIKSSSDLIGKVMRTRDLISAKLEFRSIEKSLLEIVQDMKQAYPDVTFKVDLAIKGAVVKADAFLQILYSNIIENAVIYNKGPNPCVWVNLELSEDGYLVSIADNGLGIAAHQYDSLFDPKRRFGGVGIHQSRQIAAKYGGRITISERISGDYTKGAMFSIWIPIPTDFES